MITIVWFCASCAFLLQWRLWWYERRCDDHRIDIDETCRRDPYLSQVPKRPHPQQRGRWICLKQDDYWDCGDEGKNQDDNVMYLPELKIRVIIYWQLENYLLTHKDNGSYQQCVLKGGCVIIAWFGLIWFIFGDAHSYVERLFYTNEQK